MVLSLQGKVTGSNPVAPTWVFQKSLHIHTSKETKYYEIMKYKKELTVLLIFLTFAWPVFDILDPSYTPTQVF